MQHSFEAYKIKQQIKRQGKTFIFQRNGKNEFGEANGEKISITVEGIYHEQSSHIAVKESEATRYQSKPVPSILMTWESFTKNPIVIDDTTTMNARTYRVTGTINIQEGNFGADISMEVVV